MSSFAHLWATIPAPSFREIELGPLDIRMYALTLLAGIAVGTWMTMRRWEAQGGDTDLVLEVALWGTAGGLIGGRIYHVITSYDQLGDDWWAPFAIWEGGLGIWGGVLGACIAGAVVVRRRGASVTRFMDAVAPGLLVGQGIGRLGNYFNPELYDEPTNLPWSLEVALGFRPFGLEATAAYHPVFLYEMLWNFGLAALLIWLGHRFAIRAPGVFALYVSLYSLGRVFWEQFRIDPSEEFLGQRLNFYVALALFVGGAIAFYLIQFGKRFGDRAPEPSVPKRRGGARVKPAAAAAGGASKSASGAARAEKRDRKRRAGGG
ncbi:MAG: prolipoprotein diacylglyceryl transferase [Miltoncostaeaceae bacterium]